MTFSETHLFSVFLEDNWIVRHWTSWTVPCRPYFWQVNYWT